MTNHREEANAHGVDRRDMLKLGAAAAAGLVAGGLDAPVDASTPTPSPWNPVTEAVRYTLTLPVSTVIVGCDSIAQLEENVAIARDFTPLTIDQLAAIEKRAEPVARQALFYRRWDT